MVFVARRGGDVDGAAFVPAFFGEFDAAGGVKRDAHLRSKSR